MNLSCEDLIILTATHLRAAEVYTTPNAVKLALEIEAEVKKQRTAQAEAIRKANPSGETLC
jgi:hypothetical protein